MVCQQNLVIKTCSTQRALPPSIPARSKPSVPQPAAAAVDRRALLGGAVLLCGLRLPTTLPAWATAAPVLPAVVRLADAPDQSLYDAADPRLRSAAQLVQDALNASDVQQEEALWSKIIAEYGGVDTPWGADVVGRAYGNRGNARSRQGNLEAALGDYNEAIKLCPWSVDPVLNRGVVLEALGRFDEAIVDYQAVLAAAPSDPSAWNNYGNALAGSGDWAGAAEKYGRAAQLAPQFSFAAANKALADFELGRDDAAFRQMRALLRRYPEFADVRAALTAALWDVGLQAKAEEEWGRVSDPRYRDLQWLKTNRRWPPRLQRGLAAFLGIKDIQR